MKTLEIKDLLKKELLLVELPEDTQFDVLVNNPLWKDGIKFLTGTDEKFHLIEGNYTLLGSPDEIKEEDVKDLVERTGLGNPSYSGEWYECYKNPDAMYSKATDSFNSALEKNIFWVNTEQYPSPYDPRSKTGRYKHGEELEKAERVWNEAQEKTFDRNRSIIFIKN